jgi:hypothetical protein
LAGRQLADGLRRTGMGEIRASIGHEIKATFGHDGDQRECRVTVVE